MGQHDVRPRDSTRDVHVPTHHWADHSEKCALSRAVLKLTNLYEHGVFGEDEDVHRD